MLRITMIMAVAVTALFTAHAQADEAKTEAEALKVGDTAPDFDLPGADAAPADAPKKLSDFKGKKNVVLAFYPKAKTSGCTKQLCGYRDDFAMFQDNDTEVIAISIDEQAYSDEFKKEQSYQFYVLGDTDGSVVEAYKIPKMQRGDNAYAQRSIMVVDKEGVIQYIDMEYNIGDDAEPLYAAVKKVNGGDKAEG